MRSLNQILSARIVAADLADKAEAAKPRNTNPPPPREDSIRLAPPDVPRRLLHYGGASWNSQLNVVRGPCWFKLCVVANKGGVDFWLWVCDSDADTSTELCPVYVPVGTTQSIDRTTSPRFMPNGIYVCATTDPVTKTLLTSNDAFFELAYETEY